MTCCLRSPPAAYLDGALTTDTGITHLLAPNASAWTGAGTNSYVVAARAGACAVVDPGSDDEAHLAALARTAASYGALEAILITHGHPDHLGGAVQLRALTGAPIYMSHRTDAGIADRELSDDAVIALGERRLRAIATPGHRFDHLCFLLEDARVLLAGDVVAGTGTVVIAPPEGDLADYLASLKRLQALDLRQILPGHGPPIDDPTALLDGYLRHREQREQQVLAGLAAGADGVDALVARIYPDLDPALHLAATLSVTAHLQKLAQEGRAIHVPERDAWRLAR